MGRHDEMAAGGSSARGVYLGSKTGWMMVMEREGEQRRRLTWTGVMPWVIYTYV